MVRAMFSPKLVALACLLGVGISAQAFDIQLNIGANLAANPSAIAAFQRAANSWKVRIDDPITIVIDADLAPLAPNVIGETSSVYLYGDTFAEIRDAMVADDYLEGGSLLQSLPTFAQLNVILPAGRTLFNSIGATQANLKALGFTGLEAVSGSISDAMITFSSNFAFDFDNSDGVGAGLIDFQTAAAHEIGHALGFVSAVDDIDYTTAAQYPQITINPLDLFRFGNGVGGNPTTLAEFTSFARDLTPGHAAHFDNLVHEYQMATGYNNGDGTQASHWKDDQLTGTLFIDQNGTHFEPGPLIGIMDPTLSYGVSYGPSDADFAALDAIGYHVLPEPGSGALLAIGALAGLGRRRRR